MYFNALLHFKFIYPKLRWKEIVMFLLMCSMNYDKLPTEMRVTFYSQCDRRNSVKGIILRGIFARGIIYNYY